jgi:hypothetical protein
MADTITVQANSNRNPPDEINLIGNIVDGGNWLAPGGVQTLTRDAGAVNVSGVLLFQLNADGERFGVAVGLDGNVPWCDIVTGVPAGHPPVALLDLYMDNRDRAVIRENHLVLRDLLSPLGTPIQIVYTVGNNLATDVTIG